MRSVLITAAISYLLGTVPFGYLLVRIFRGQDVRHLGSGNIGATNVSRTSPVLGMLTLALDAAKGTAAVLVTRQMFPGQPVLLGVAALAAVLGHMFPIWLKFRGGKGVATALGSFAWLTPWTVLAMVWVFVAFMVLFRYVSLASILTAALFPLASWILDGSRNPPLALGLVAIACALIIARHHQNIRRLLAGTEPRWRSE